MIRNAPRHNVFLFFSRVLFGLVQTIYNSIRHTHKHRDVIQFFLVRSRHRATRVAMVAVFLLLLLCTKLKRRIRHINLKKQISGTRFLVLFFNFFTIFFRYFSCFKKSTIRYKTCLDPQLKFTKLYLNQIYFQFGINKFKNTNLRCIFFNLTK